MKAFSVQRVMMAGAYGNEVVQLPYSWNTRHSAFPKVKLNHCVKDEPHGEECKESNLNSYICCVCNPGVTGAHGATSYHTDICMC